MFKRVIIYSILLLYANAMLFLPKAAGVDIYDTRDHKKDEINSLFEYIYQIVLGNKDKTPEDEDGNTSGDCFLQKINIGQVYQVVNIEPIQITIQHPENKISYFNFGIIALQDGVKHITVPPPKA
jgi:hypothetical protein